MTSDTPARLPLSQTAAPARPAPVPHPPVEPPSGAPAKPPESAAPGGAREQSAAPPRKAWWQWRYDETGRRDLRLDALRGFCAFAMIVDHMGGGSFLYPITGGNRFFVSAAEGFIFLSGLLVGLIYGPRVFRDGLAAVQLHLLRRAATLYGVTVGLTFTFVGLSRLARMPWLEEIEPLTAELAVSILALHRTYYLVDVMLFYTIMLALAPLAILLFHTDRTWVVLLFSVGLWLLYQWFPAAVEVPWAITNNDTFRVPAWQLWFFGGAVIGYHRGRIWSRLNRLPRVPAALVLVLAAAGLIYLGLVTGYAPAAGTPAAVTPEATQSQGALDPFFDKHFARPGRVLAFAVFFPLLYLFTTYVWRPLARVAGWLLIPFGQNALYVYAMHLFAVYLSALVLPYVPGFDRFNPWHNTPVQLAAVLGIWLLVRRQVLFDVIPR
jgi:hypothetical protein